MDSTLRRLQPLSQMPLDEFVVDDLNTQSVGNSCGYIFAQRPHFTGHCNDSHGSLLFTARAAFASPTSIYQCCDILHLPTQLSKRLDIQNSRSGRKSDPSSNDITVSLMPSTGVNVERIHPRVVSIRILHSS